MDRPVFNIGLTMAGAISAGAYTAGVIDFLLEALKEWEKDKIQNQDLYPYDVQINSIAGASAGGITAAIILKLLGNKFETTNNLLYKSWVEDIHIKKLLQDNDLQQDNVIRSLLDSTVLDNIAQNILQINPNYDQWPSYINENLHILISIANIRGIPYHLNFKGEKENKEKDIKQHGMLMHEDFMHFIFSEKEPSNKIRFSNSAIWLDPKKKNNGSWDILINSALASSAFPIGLASRKIRRNLSDYDNREWLIYLDCIQCTEKEKKESYIIKQIQPSWPKDLDRQYIFNCVDGGLMNNEPFEWLSSMIPDSLCNNDKNDKLNSALLMIDPFPQTNPLDLTKSVHDLDIFGVFSGMFSALKNQARFKLDEIKRSELNPNQERFIISPTRTKAVNSPIASGSLGGFGGFLSESFRYHDFILGRRNCQYFLQHHFTLPNNHPIFKKKGPNSILHNKDGETPIIPLCGTAKDKIERPTLPSYTNRELSNLKGMIKKRVTSLVNKGLDNYIDNFLSKRFLKVFTWFYKKSIVNKIVEKVQNDLEENDLYHRNKCIRNK